MHVCECVECGKPYELTEMSGGFPGGKELEDIRCPHCGDMRQEISSGFFRTNKLSAKAEKEWRATRR